MKKIVFGILALIVIAVVVGVFFVVSNFGSLVAAVIAEAGSRVTGTSVTVGGVDIQVKEGRGSVSDIAVANPQGFSGAQVFSLGEVTLDINVQSLRSADPIIVEMIRVAAPQVRFEMDKDGRSNVDVIRKHAESVTARPSRGAGDSKDEPPRMIIESIQFEKGKIMGDASALGIEPFEVTLPSFTLSDVGAPNGAPPDQIGKIILGALTRKAAEAVARDKAGDVIEDQLKDSLGDKIKQLFD